ncbi:MAG: hypothetical protein H7238_08510 [Polaromonas sp.]|nr:hypothetical protein [Polaromonas sp.]
MTVISLDLNSRMLDMANPLGMNISETADRLLLIEVNKRLEARDDPSPPPSGHP